MKILFCDDKVVHRELWSERLSGSWKKLMVDNDTRGIFYETLEIETCANIDAGSDSRSSKELGGFDGFLLDILWHSAGLKKPEPRGIEIAEVLRSKYPEKPIMMFTEYAAPEYFNRLVHVNISAYLSKKESYRTLCFEIMQSIESHRKAKGGQCLYRQLRQLTAPGAAWAAESVGRAATDVWNLHRSHDRWEAFWNAFQGPIASQRLTKVFSKMREFFGGADLLMLGTLPGMRGHLDHVLNVYFTGYVISNVVPRFREHVTAAARRLFPDNHVAVANSESKHWELFQLAWLASATLHDTAYPLEIQPDLVGTCWDITSQFNDILSGVSSAPKHHCPSVQCSGLNDIALLLGKLNNGTVFSDLLQQNSTFTRDGVTRINHGVASALLFLVLANKAIAMKEREPELDTYLKWAAAAMALHSLKIPGSKAGVSISLERDPLSYLLMACDEIQVWDRERPDASRMSTPFSGTDLMDLSVSADAVTAVVNYELCSGAAASAEFAAKRKSMDEDIEADGAILAKYCYGNGFAIKVKRRVPSLNADFAPLCF